MTRLLLIFFLATTHCFAGVSVIGTRFVIDNNTQKLAIKVVNDNESDYLVKTDITDRDEFIISPPLFVLPQNTTNLITIVPNNLKKGDKDKLYRLSITTIPKSRLTERTNTVSLAVRSHFYFIYRHDNLKNADFNQLKLTNENGQFYLKNLSNYVLTFRLSGLKNSATGTRKTLAPEEKLLINKECINTNSNFWISFLDDDDNIIKKTNIFCEVGSR